MNTSGPHPVTGNETLRKADKVGALDGCRSQGLNRQCDRFFGSDWELKVGERDSKCAHSSSILASPLDNS
jgi:hypothetical protein